MCQVLISVDLTDPMHHQEFHLHAIFQHDGLKGIQIQSSEYGIVCQGCLNNEEIDLDDELAGVLSHLYEHGNHSFHLDHISREAD